MRNSLLIIYLTIILCIGQFNNISAYNNGLELGDEAELMYTLRVDGSVYQGQANQSFTTTVSYDGLIIGFVDIILGMKVGEYVGNIIIPADKAYTDPSAALYGKDLDYDIKILRLISDVTPDADDDDDGGESVFENTTARNALIVIAVFGGLVGVIIIGIYGKKFTEKIVAKKCISCSVVSDGYCATCG